VTPTYRYRLERLVSGDQWEPIEDRYFRSVGPLTPHEAQAVVNDARDYYGCHVRLVYDVVEQGVAATTVQPPSSPSTTDLAATSTTLMQLKEQAEGMIRDLATVRNMTGNWIEIGAPIQALKDCANHFRGAASALSHWQNLCAEHKRWMGGKG